MYNFEDQRGLVLVEKNHAAWFELWFSMVEIASPHYPFPHCITPGGLF